MPFEDNQFDFVVSCQVIEHIVDIKVYIAEIQRVLKDDGVVMFTTPNAAIRLEKNMRPWYKFHVKEYLHDELAAELKKHFPAVAVRGLFADDVIYQTEINRVTLIKEKARILQKLTDKRWLRYIKFRLKKHAYKKQNTLNASWAEDVKQKSLFYNDQNLETSLDFLVLCANNNDTIEQAGAVVRNISSGKE